MRALLQRVAWAEVEVAGRIAGRIENGLLVYVAVAAGDTRAQAAWLAEKIANLRIFEDDQGKLNRSVQDARGDILVISNFTLLADARKGRRPAFVAAADFERARPLHEAFVDDLRGRDVKVAVGVFGARMAVQSQADGPVNIIIDASE